MRNIPSAQYYNLTGGMDDKSDAIEMPPTKFRAIYNLMVQWDSLVKRGGKSKRFSTALESGGNLQRIHQYEDASQNRLLIYAINGKIYKDNVSAQTDITGTATGMDNARDAIYQFVNYDGQCIGSDSTVAPFVIASTTSDAAPMGGSTPSVARAVASFKEHLFFGDIDDLDGTRYPYRVVWNNPPTLTDFPLDRSNDLDRNSRIVAMHNHGDHLLVFQEHSVWYVDFRPTGDAYIQSPFVFHRLAATVGAVSAQSIVTTDNGTFFLSEKGPYWIPPELQPPIYIGKPIETFWSGLNRARIQYASGCEMPEKNGVLFSVPDGSNQVNNNRCIFLNYQVWSRIGREVHPAFSIFRGVESNAWAFNSLCTVLDSSRQRAIGGGYDGFVYTMDEGADDSGDAIEAYFTTPYYHVGDRSREKLWYGFAIDVDLEAKKTVTIRATYYEDPNPIYETITQDAQGGTILGQTFILGASALGGSDYGRIEGDLEGESRYLELRVDIEDTTSTFGVHGIILFFKMMGRWA